MSEETLPASFWNERYANEDTAWDIGYVSTPIKTYIDQLTRKDLRILIPGGGRSHEAVYLASQGFTDITVIDISSVLTAALQRQLGDAYPSIQIITADFFTLHANYDLILEQTFFCALHPSLRKKYAEKMQELLAGNGTLAGLLFNREFDSNPPYGGSIGEYRQLFEGRLRIKTLEECYNSIPRRAGSELFLVAHGQ